MTGILDEYPGAAAAYSLRLLNTDYTGDAVVVRRASDNATQSIGFVDGELDTTALDTFCSGTDGFVATWYDQSGNGYNAVNATASGQPKIYDSINGIITENSKPSILFDGANDWLNANYSNSQFSQLFVVKNTIDGAAIAFSGTVQLIDNRYYTPDGSVNFSLSTIPFALFTVDNINFKGYLNSIDKTTPGTVFTQAFIRTYIGSSNGLATFTDGTISEIILYPYNTDQSSNRTGIETNINDFYSIY